MGYGFANLNGNEDIREASCRGNDQAMMLHTSTHWSIITGDEWTIELQTY